jgi:hypothetical protein
MIDSCAVAVRFPSSMVKAQSGRNQATSSNTGYGTTLQTTGTDSYDKTESTSSEVWYRIMTGTLVLWPSVDIFQIPRHNCSYPIVFLAKLD